MKQIALLTVLACAAGSPALAQSRDPKPPLELGVDAMWAREWAHATAPQGGNVSITSSASRFEFPQALRLGLPINDQLELEPALSVLSLSSDGITSTILSAEVGLVIDLSPDRRQPQWFVRPLVGWDHNGFFLSDANRLAFGVGAGVRMPVTDRISMRYEARYRHDVEANNVSGDLLGLLAGVSVYTR